MSTLFPTRYPAERPAWSWVALLGLAWVLAVGAGLVLMSLHERGGHPPPQAPAHWPGRSSLPPPDGRAVLVVFLHPRCPCVPAALETLDDLVRQLGPVVGVTIAMVRPPGAGREFLEGPSWVGARQIPGARVLEDHDGVEAERFGARISGSTLLYEPGGSLVFAGGINRARGWPGPSRAEAVILAAVTAGSDPSRFSTSEVFGCSFRTSGTQDMPGRQPWAW